VDVSSQEERRAAAGSLGRIAKKRLPPSPRTTIDAEELRRLLAKIPEAHGTYVREKGRHLVVGRPEALGPKGEEEDDDRLELRSLGAGAYGVFARGADGQLGFTDIGGGIGDLDEGLRGPLLHLLRRWTPERKSRGRRRTSGTRH
jgi:hypothetical protein